MKADFGAYVPDVLFDRSGAIFALGDGSVRFENGAMSAVHEGAALCAAARPSSEGVLTGGDDGRLVWSRGPGPETLAEAPGRWIDALVTRVAGAGPLLATGLDDGRVWRCDLTTRRIEWLEAEKRPPITALAIADQGRVAWRGEEGGAGVSEASAVGAR